MRRKSMVLIVIAAVCGLIASIGISQVLESQSRKGAAEMETVEIFVTNAHIGLTDVITEDLVKLEKWPKDRVPQDAITDWETIKGRQPKFPLFEGEPIVKGKLVDPNDVTGATARIRKGYRALPVKVTYEMTSGLLQPGDMVDVLVVCREGGGVARTVVKTILQNVPVFAVNENIIRETNVEGKVINARTVTLEVTPEQAEKVTLASRMGDLSLTMRSPGDDASVEYGGTGISQLLGEAGEVVESPSPKSAVAQNIADNFMRFARREGQPSLPPPAPAEGKKTITIVEPTGHRVFELDPAGGLPREVMPVATGPEALGGTPPEDEPPADESTDDHDGSKPEATNEAG